MHNNIANWKCRRANALLLNLPYAVQKSGTNSWVLHILTEVSGLNCTFNFFLRLVEVLYLLFLLSFHFSRLLLTIEHAILQTCEQNQNSSRPFVVIAQIFCKLIVIGAQVSSVLINRISKFILFLMATEKAPTSKLVLDI